MIYIILLVGFIFRIISLNQSLWLDEATSALVAKMSVGDIFTKFLPGDFHPPFYYLVLKYWSSIFGYSEVSLRIPSIVFGVFTIYLIYLIAIKIFNKQIALMAAVLMATSGLAIYYSQEARMYSLAAFLVSLAFYLFIYKKWILFSITLLLIGATDYVALFVVPVFLIIDYKNWKTLLFSLVPLCLGFFFWLPIFIRQLKAGVSVSGSAWWNILGSASFKNIALIPVKFIFGRVSLDNKVVYGMVVVLAALLFGYLFFKARKASRILWGWLIIPIVIGILVSFKIPTLSYFRFLFCLPVFYIILAYGIKLTTKLAKSFFIILVAINIFSASYYLLNTRFQREDWRLAANTLENEKIVFPANSQKEALIYYGKANQIVSISQLSTTDNEVWLSRYVWEIFDPQDLTRKKLENLGYNKAEEDNFNGVVVWKYIGYHENRN